MPAWAGAKRPPPKPPPTTPPPGYIPGLPPAWVTQPAAPVYAPGVPTGLLPPSIATTPAPTGGGGNIPGGGGGTTFAPSGGGWYGGGGGAAPTTPSSGYGGTSFGVTAAPTAPAVAPAEPQWALDIWRTLNSPAIQAALPTIPPGFAQQALNVLGAIMYGKDLGSGNYAPAQPPVTPPMGYQPGIPPAWQPSGPGVPRPTALAQSGTPERLYLPMRFRGPGLTEPPTAIRDIYASAPSAPAGGLGIVQPPATPATAGDGSPGYGGGGGGGGGYYGTTPTTTEGGLPVVYATWFESIFGPVATYYTLERGGVGQAYKDYQSLMYLWQSLTGSLPTMEQLNGMLTIIKQRLNVLGRAPTFDDVLDYVKFLASPKGNPPAVSYLRVGEV